MTGFLLSVPDECACNGGRFKVPHPHPPGIRTSDVLPRTHHNKLRINVGGMRHETYKSTLWNLPDTRLAWLAGASTNNNADYDPVAREFYFDRHPIIFTSILNFYRTGRLHAPSDVCGPAFEAELQFWGIDEKQIEPCCWSNYTQHRDAQETLAKLQGDSMECSDGEGEDDDVAKIFGIDEESQQTKVSWYTKWRPRIWVMLEEPYSSTAAKIFAMVSLIFVMLSICAFCMETAKPFQVELTYNATGEPVTYTEPVPFLFAVEGICVAFFTIELIARFAFCPKKCRFFLSVETIIDIVACIPFYVDGMKKIMDRTTLAGTDILSFLRIVRVFRIFKLARHLSGLQVLMHTLRASAKELLLLIVFMALGVLITSSLVYYAERWAGQEGAKNDFENIPVGFWWAIVTMTTVGYGDLVPRTWLGMIVGAVTAVIGVLTLALPVPVIVNNFALYYTHAQARAKLPKKRKRALVGAADALKTQSVQFVSSSISGYSSQSTNEDGDDVSIRSEDVKTVSGLVHHRPHNSVAPLSASGVETEMTVTYTDEETGDPVPSAPGHLLSPTQSENTASTTASSKGTHRRHTAKRNSTAATTRRESFMPNGVKGRSRQAQTRRQSMMPTMPEVESDDDYYIADF